MAITTKIRITRDKLSDFVKDPDTIRQFELLVTQANKTNSPIVKTIDDAVDITLELPSVDIDTGRQIYRRTGSGSGDLILNTQNLEELILLSGTSVSSITLSGEETLEIYIASGKLWVLTN